jgi:hypothetical protein
LAAQEAAAEKYITAVLNNYLDSLKAADNQPCSDSAYQPPRYRLNNWEIVILPKVDESSYCDKKLSAEVNSDFAKHGPVQQVDIEYSAEAGCVPEVFMISQVGTGSLMATGHLSCFNVSAVVHGKKNYFFNQHVDVRRVRDNAKLDELYEKALSSRLAALKDSSKIDSLEIIIGASNLADTSDIKTYLEDSRYLTEAIEKTKLFSHLSVWFCAGPNAVVVPLDTIFKYGGIDRFTTDVIIIPDLNKIYVSRPVNSQIFDEPFKEAEKQADKYRSYFSKNTPRYVAKLSDIK